MQLSVELAYFGVCFLVSLVVFFMVGLWYLLPRLSTLSLEASLTPLLFFSAFRVNGLYFLVPGVASPDIPRGFALPTAYGDAATGILAVVAVVALRYWPSTGVALTWTYGVLGWLDLLNALAQVVIQHVMPAHRCLDLDSANDQRSGPHGRSSPAVRAFDSCAQTGKVIGRRECVFATHK